ncbi:MAG: preprotein translocase subunit YajC [Cellulomonas sp.]|uniref:preprotein translocase subunit YajC n=1 Tax=Cellulomonas sp. 73-92 TaxID=1895740 RepID=UPI00092721C5|nr:preprotein translocase subunit YajC [Cellulomonas sp. 73-92]MBN9375916.1 preprotein translocase subunit YajC [Cellulomonas sp.]OJV80263.1 MAG: preprotein translocase subunit YajC [Cellulomonas sp. 73-92]
MGSNTIIWAILIVLLGAMWFMSRRSRQQQQKAQEFRNNLKPGDEVMTHSGMLGTVVEVEGDNITLESGPGSRSRWIRAAIAKLIEPTTEVADVDDEADDQADDDYYEGDDVEVPDDISSLDPSHGTASGDEDDETGKEAK